MFCKNCGKQIDPESKFCPYCGGRVKEIESPEIKSTEIPEEAKIKTYSSIFWKYFGILILANILIGIFEAIEIPIFWMIVLGVYTYFFCRLVNEAMLSVGKKNWWLLGLLVLIPLGFWITFFVVRSQLKSHGKWSVKGEKISPWVIIAIVLIIIAIIGILASIVLVSLSGARQRARDARITADLSQVRVIAELINSDYDDYNYLCDLIDDTLNQGAPTSYGSQLAEIENDILTQQGGTLTLTCYTSPLGSQYCIEAKISEGFYCVDSAGNQIQTTTPKCGWSCTP